MQAITLKVRADKDGVIRLEIPAQMADQEVEIVVVMQPLVSEALDEMGYPLGYFDETYGMFANDPIERNQPSHPDRRDEIA